MMKSTQVFRLWRLFLLPSASHFGTTAWLTSPMASWLPRDEGQDDKWCFHQVPCSTDSQHVAQLSQTPHGEVIYIRCYPGGINPQKPKTDPPKPDRTPMGDLIRGRAKPLVSESGVRGVFHVFFTEDVSKHNCVLSRRCWCRHIIVPQHFTDVKMAGWETIRLLLTREREGPPAVTAKSWKLTCHRSLGRITGSLFLWKCE